MVGAIECEDLWVDAQKEQETLSTVGPIARLKTWVDSWSSTTKICVFIIISVWVLRTLSALTGWYVEDDFIFKYNAATEPLSGSYLFRSHYGNLMPAALLVEWIRVRLISGEFWSAALISGVAYVASSLLLMRLLQRWVRSGTAIVVAVCWFSIVLLSAETQFWWSATLNGGLMLPFLLLAALLGLDFVDSGNRRRLIWGGVSLVVALLFFEKAISMGVWALLAIWVWRALRPAASEAVRQRAWIAAGTAVGISVLYLAFFVLFQTAGEGAQFSMNLIILLMGTAARLLMVSVVGGPWSWWTHPDGSVTALPTSTELLISAELLFVFVAAALWLRRHSWRIVAAGILVAVASATLLLLGRVAQPLDAFGPDRALALRYSGDLIMPLAVVLALLLSPAIGERKAWRGPVAWVRDRLPKAAPGRRVLVFVALNLFLASAVFSWAGYVPGWASNKGGDWASAASREINKLPAGVTVVDQPVPDTVRKRQVSAYSLSASVLAPFVAQSRWVSQSSTLTAIDGYGFVGPGYVDGPTLAGPIKGCGWKLAPGASATAGLALPLEQRQWLFHMGYLSGAVGSFEIEIGASPTATVTVDQGLSNTFVAVEGGGSQIRMKNLTNSTVCVSNVAVGRARLLTPPQF